MNTWQDQIVTLYLELLSSIPKCMTKTTYCSQFSPWCSEPAKIPVQQPVYWQFIVNMCWISSERRVYSSCQGPISKCVKWADSMQTYIMRYYYFNSSADPHGTSKRSGAPTKLHLDFHKSCVHSTLTGFTWIYTHYPCPTHPLEAIACPWWQSTCNYL